MLMLLYTLACLVVGALADHYLERKLMQLAEKLKKAASDLK
jgi:hypothetical protein